MMSYLSVSPAVTTTLLILLIGGRILSDTEMYGTTVRESSLWYQAGPYSSQYHQLLMIVFS